MKTYLQIIFLAISSSLFAQNLVVNPSFESHSACPYDYCQISFADGWYTISGAPCYFNTCGINGFGVPVNKYGNHQASTGNGYAEFSIGGDYELRIDNLGGQLTSPLVVGQKYFVNFNICLAGSSSIVSDQMGIGFSKYKYGCPGVNPIPPCGILGQWLALTLEVYSHNIITDSVNWTNISGSFIADSAYNYFSIGYFVWPEALNTVIIDSSAAQLIIYYLDDVCVSTDSTTYLSMGIHENSNINDLITIFPNPAKDFIYINIPIGVKVSEIEIRNIQGSLLKSHPVSNRQNKVSVGDFPKGVYFISIITDKDYIVKKLVKD